MVQVKVSAGALECGSASNPSQVVWRVHATRLLSMAGTLRLSWLLSVLIVLLLGLQGEPRDTPPRAGERSLTNHQ